MRDLADACPIQSETFEYARVDKQYRYVSEKVIHQPPVTACMAQSPSTSRLTVSGSNNNIT